MIRASNGEPLHGLAMVEDVTEIKRTQEEALVRQKLESVGTSGAGLLTISIILRPHRRTGRVGDVGGGRW